MGKTNSTFVHFSVCTLAVVVQNIYPLHNVYHIPTILVRSTTRQARLTASCPQPLSALCKNHTCSIMLSVRGRHRQCLCPGVAEEPHVRQRAVSLQRQRATSMRATRAWLLELHAQRCAASRRGGSHGAFAALVRAWACSL